MCDVSVREMGNTHNWTVQCVLMVNMFAEKIFVFLWFWFAVVAVFTLMNMIYWLYVTFSQSESRAFVKKYLEYNNIEAFGPDIDVFIRDSMCKDGVTILRLMSDNCGDFGVAEIVKQLWKVHIRSGITEPHIK
ncbi:hypothetical protein AB6A40_010060 [Gnathostoma spinigerum]|uniref:Innexin n=1 Tax=Gnathostoma spinigerum TaxID=75299 RepID=A0ABD6F0E1_9BILA